jgi:fumarate hydratase class I
MKIIQQADVIDSIADALQFISYYHPLDYIQAVGRAWEKEQSPAAKDAMAQILMNSRMSAEGKRPMRQDTGIVTLFAKIGMGVQFSGKTTPLRSSTSKWWPEMKSRLPLPPRVAARKTNQNSPYSIPVTHWLTG